MKYNIPRVPVERTDDLTEYEFDYEIELEYAYAEWLKSAREELDPVEWVQDGSNAKFSKGIGMDPQLYDDIKARAERGEYIPFELPDETNVPRLSKQLAARQTPKQIDPEDLEPVNPADAFGGGPVG